MHDHAHEAQTTWIVHKPGNKMLPAALPRGPTVSSQNYMGHVNT